MGLGNKCEVIDVFTDVMQYQQFFCYFHTNKTKNTSIHVDQFVIPNLVNMLSFIKNSLQARENMGPITANIYKRMHARGQRYFFVWMKKLEEPAVSERPALCSYSSSSSMWYLLFLPPKPWGQAKILVCWKRSINKCTRLFQRTFLALTFFR